MSTVHRCAAVLLVTALVIALRLSSAAAQDPHSLVEPSLVYLAVTAEDSERFVQVSGTGTGFVITPDGQVLTAWHLLGDLGPNIKNVRITANLAERQGVEVEEIAVIGTLADRDLLLLKLPERLESYKAVELGASAGLQRLTNVFTSGFPLGAGNLPAPMDGKLSVRQGPGGSVWTTNMQFEGGRSGSPVYLEDGRVIGVVKGTHKDAPTINYFTPIDFADPLLVPVRLEALRHRIDSIQCRVCLQVTGLDDNMCTAVVEPTCSGWDKASGVEEAAWSEPLQIRKPKGNDFADCKLSFRMECK